MLEFLKTHYVELIAAALFIVAIVLMFRRGYKKQAKSIVLALVAAAEARWGGGTGEIKYAEVVSLLYEKLPAFARMLIGETTISKIIESAVGKLKEILG